MSREIPLTQGYVAIVDDEDYEELSKHRWHATKHRSGVRAVRSVQGNEHGKRKKIHMHREIMGVSSEQIVDHRNFDTLDNQRHNLRACTNAQNLAHRRKQAGTSSIYKGVYFHKARHSWCAALMFSGQHVHLGYFEHEIAAARAYNMGAAKYFGEFALLNEV